jgi:hypothetical protein
MQEPFGRIMTRKERTRFAAIVSALALAALACARQTAPKGPPSPPSITQSETARATFKLMTVVAETSDHAVKIQSWAATAWIVGGSPSTGSLLMTAGHACESATVRLQPIGKGPGATSLREVHVSAEHRLVPASGDRYYKARVVVDDDEVDLCVLATDEYLGPPLLLARADPSYGAAGWYVGAPHSEWGGGVAPMFGVLFAGRGTLFKGNCDTCDAVALAFATTATHGASGSPIVVGGRVVAVLNLVDPEFPAIAEGVPWDVAARILARAEHPTAPAR